MAPSLVGDQMRVLNKRKIRWIVKHWVDGDLSHYRIARTQSISPRHARRVFNKYCNSKEIVLHKPGRLPKPITKEEIQLVAALYKTQPMGAVNMEKVLTIDNQHIPHNRIHKIMKQQGLAFVQPNKSRKRKYIRFERKYSNSLWHIDWKQFHGKQLCAVLDDASRLVVGYGLFDNATSENSIKTVNKAILSYGVPKQLLSDHGVQFTSIARESCSDPAENQFQQFLKHHGIQHIKARIKHPQTNGKLERWWQTAEFLTKHFGTLQKAVKHYNEKRPHMSLNTDVALVTPMQAFLQKQRG